MLLICPYCHVAFSISGYNDIEPFLDQKDKDFQYEIKMEFCPECKGLIVVLRGGKEGWVDDEYPDDELDWERIIYPIFNEEEIVKSPHIPAHYISDYIEAKNILIFSPKASAALSRRLLQNLLNNVLGIKKNSLFEEITEFKNNKEIPSYIVESIDIIREFGNIAAHPKTIKSTGEILDVETGEAEWSLELIKEIFDHIFVKPNIHRIRVKQHLNKRLPNK